MWRSANATQGAVAPTGAGRECGLEKKYAGHAFDTLPVAGALVPRTFARRGS